MIIYMENLHGERFHFVINSYQDLEPVFQQFPMAQEAAAHSHNLKEAAENIANYISSHHWTSWVEDDRLAKNLKAKLLGAGLLAAGLPAANKISEPAQPPAYINYGECNLPEESYLPFGKHRDDRFLWNVMQIESSGGNDLDHPMISDGPHRGERAIGRWALLRPTIREVIRRQIQDKTVDPKILGIYDHSRDQMEEFFKKRPHLELEVARYLARHVLQNHNNNYERGAYAWLNGHNLKNIDDEKVKNSSYVSKFREYDLSNPFGRPVKKSEELFDRKLEKWLDKRRAQINALLPNFSIAPDPGRVHQDKPAPRKGDIGELKDAIIEAKKLSKQK